MHVVLRAAMDAFWLDVVFFPFVSLWRDCDSQLLDGMFKLCAI